MNNKRCYYHLGNSKVLGSCGPGTRDKDQMYFFITPFSLHLPPNVFLITPHTESEPLGVGPSSPCPNNFSRRLRGTLKFVYHCSVIFFFFLLVLGPTIVNLPHLREQRESQVQ